MPARDLLFCAAVALATTWISRLITQRSFPPATRTPFLAAYAAIGAAGFFVAVRFSATYAPIWGGLFLCWIVDGLIWRFVLRRKSD